MSASTAATVAALSPTIFRMLTPRRAALTLLLTGAVGVPLASPPPAWAQAVSPDDLHACLAETRATQYRRDFAFSGTCKSLDSSSGCYHYDYRDRDLDDSAGLDQRGRLGFQLTFPARTDRWAAVSVREAADERFCWSGGAIVGRNPLAMTWGGRTGTKERKNNFVRNEGGTVQVDGARVHNTHDTFIADSPSAGFDIRHSWISYTRDDLFEGHLDRLSIRDTLVDGAYSFLSAADKCKRSGSVRDAVVTIEDSLIRLQRMAGPYARDADRWHWKIEGGHGRLWKEDGCGWSNWPKFELRNNVFLIDGPASNFGTLHKAVCNLGLPGECGERELEQLLACENNLFLYRDYRHWIDAGEAPGPTPPPGSRFHNPRNPDFLPNGNDCYQRMTDDPRDDNHGPVESRWRSLRAKWIRRHTGQDDARDRVMRVAGVDRPVFGSGERLQIVSRANGRCIESEGNGRVRLAACSNSKRQRFSPRGYSDGALPGAVLLVDHRGAALRTQDPDVLERDDDDDRFDPRVFAEDVPDLDRPGFRERWYLLPTEKEPGGERDVYAIESDALRRTYLEADGRAVKIQRLYEDGDATPTPQRTDYTRSSDALRWTIRKR